MRINKSICYTIRSSDMTLKYKGEAFVCWYWQCMIRDLLGTYDLGLSVDTCEIMWICCGRLSQDITYKSKDPEFEAKRSVISLRFSGECTGSLVFHTILPSFTKTIGKCCGCFNYLYLWLLILFKHYEHSINNQQVGLWQRTGKIFPKLLHD